MLYLLVFGEKKWEFPYNTIRIVLSVVCVLVRRFLPFGFWSDGRNKRNFFIALIVFMKHLLLFIDLYN